MARRKVVKQEILESQITQEIQAKVTEQLQKNTNALIKVSNDISNTIAEKTERLEEIRQDFIREENKMVETRENHKISMELLEDETKEKSEELISVAKQDCEEMIKNAKLEAEKINRESNDAAKRAMADHEFTLEQNARKEKEAFLSDRRNYYETYCEENKMATISVDTVDALETKLATIVESNGKLLTLELANLKTNLEKDFILEETKIRATYDNKIAQFEPRIDSLEKELKRAEERAAEYKSIIDANREAQVQMSANKSVAVNVDATNKK